MKSLIIEASNYTNVLGKSYGIGDYACNYPINTSVFNGTISCVSGRLGVTTSDNFNTLLGCSIENSNVPLYAWLISDSGFVIKIKYLIGSGAAILEYPFTGATGTHNFVAVDFFAQPAVEGTYGIDVKNSFAFPDATVKTKYGDQKSAWAVTTVPLGAEPLLLNMSSYAVLGLQIQYI